MRIFLVSLKALLAFGLILATTAPPALFSGEIFEGKFYRGAGDLEYLQLLEKARRMFEPDPEFENLSMLYEPKWNGLVEGPTWDAWWIQNSYGTTFSILPFLREPFLTFLQNSQDLWFDQMGDGKRVGAPPPFDWVAPDGCLCDAARPGWIVYKQGDGRVAIHDWGMEFTAAGMVLQGELLLINRDHTAIAHYLPRLERCARFIESRRDPKKNLFLAGPAGNLLAPSYAGWKRENGAYDQAYLAGLSLTYIAALDRLIELEKLAGNATKASFYNACRDSARRALPLLLTAEGYFIRSLDPDGTRHGVYGAPRFGYFESSPNHDAIAFGVVDLRQSKRIYQWIASLPDLRPFDFILPNYPSYDDMYEKPEGLWAYGTWVNGGHWSTCEARMILAYYRLGQFEDARKSMRRLLTFAERFRMDNPLTKRGSDVYQPRQPFNLCYDALGPPAAFMRGLFEYQYSAEALKLTPHLPPSLNQLEQLEPVRFGTKQIYVAVSGQGPIRAVRLDGRKWNQFDSACVTLPYTRLPQTARIQILRSNAKQPSLPALNENTSSRTTDSASTDFPTLDQPEATLRNFTHELMQLQSVPGYEAAHAQLALRAIEVTRERSARLKAGNIKPLPEPSEAAADKLYVDTALRLYAGLENLMNHYRNSTNSLHQETHRLWLKSREAVYH